MINSIRTEINQILLKLPDDNLKSVLEYLKKVEKTMPNKDLETTSLLKKIFEEDAELLKKLAQ